MRLQVPIIVQDGATHPQYQTPGSAGLDLATTIDFGLQPGEYRTIPTGLSIALPQGYEAQVRPRSGLAAKHGIGMVNAPGTIDSDYRGQIHVILINHGQNYVEFRKGDRIAQMVISPVIQVELVQFDQLDETERGTGGFGSTGGAKSLESDSKPTIGTELA